MLAMSELLAPNIRMQLVFPSFTHSEYGFTELGLEAFESCAASSSILHLSVIKMPYCTIDSLKPKTEQWAIAIQLPLRLQSAWLRVITVEPISHWFAMVQISRYGRALPLWIITTIANTCARTSWHIGGTVPRTSHHWTWHGAPAIFPAQLVQAYLPVTSCYDIRLGLGVKAKVQIFMQGMLCQESILPSRIICITCRTNIMLTIISLRSQQFSSLESELYTPLDLAT